MLQQDPKNLKLNDKIYLVNIYRDYATKPETKTDENGVVWTRKDILWKHTIEEYTVIGKGTWTLEGYYPRDIDSEPRDEVYFISDNEHHIISLEELSEENSQYRGYFESKTDAKEFVKKFFASTH